MGTITTITGSMANMPEELITDIFSKVQGHSSLAKLATQIPVPFVGTEEMVFSMDDEVSIVGEGENKPPHDAKFESVVIRPVKFVYQHRLTDEFISMAEEQQLPYLQAFTDGFAKKIARGLDIAAMHGINPKDGADASFKSTNSFDGLVSNLVTYAAATVDVNIEDGVALVNADNGSVTGLALSTAAGTALSKIKVNGVAQYPEFRFGQNPNAFYGMGSDVNSTVSVTGTATGAVTDQIILGDFQNAFKWGYAKNIPLEVIQYGDPDGLGDLKRKNQIVLRTEAYIGWGILDADSFAIVR
jgi:hypothetical protein